MHMTIIMNIPVINGYKSCIYICIIIGIHDHGITRFFHELGNHEESFKYSKCGRYIMLSNVDLVYHILPSGKRLHNYGKSQFSMGNPL